ncbi:MAG TPA: hypothetical protein VG013_15755 [Gemmataceae bacterium]|nr:hypothetical protein [Gemmataceae bacterium]
MHEIILHLSGLQCMIWELCDLARTDKEKAAVELLALEPRIIDTINDTFVLLDQLPVCEAATISILPT